MRHDQVKTPCIGVCSTGIGDRVCRGCKRFTHEVIRWNSYTNDEKQLIEARLARFLSQCVRNRLTVVDVDLLRRQLDRQQIGYSLQRDEYCWAWNLLRTGSSQIDNPARFGLKVEPQYRSMSLSELRQAIDDECYTLSDAWYERYIDASATA